MAETDAAHEVLTTSEVAELYGVSRSTVLRWADDGRLASKRLGPKTVRYLRSDVEAFFEGRTAS